MAYLHAAVQAVFWSKQAVNAFFYDHDPMPVYVDLDEFGKRAARSRDLVSLADLVPA